MGWELEFIKLLQKGSNNFFDYLLYFITQFGDELFFLLIVVTIYWCIDKREGFRLVNLFMVSQIVVGFVKVTVKRKRPYLADGIKGIIEETEGYSFPSGHSNNISVVCTDVSLFSKRKNKKAYRFVLITSCIIVPLVMLSRMYLGQHYLTDVLVGGLVGVGVGLAGYYLFDLLKDNEEKLMYAIVPCCLILFITALVFYFKKGDTADALVNIAGTYSSASIGYYIEKRFVKYDVKSDKVWRYFVRFIVGAIIVIALKEGLKMLFGLFGGGMWAAILTEFIRYFVIGIFVTLLAPMLFKKLKI